LHRALARLHIYAPVFFGHSFGATVAMAYALQYPVARLVLASGYYYPSVRLDAPLLVPPAMPLAGTLLRHTVSPIIGRLLWPAWRRVIFSPAPVPRRFRAFPAWLALRPSQLRATGEDAAWLVPAVAEMAPQYRRLRVPTTILAGADDRCVSARAHSMRLHGEIAGSEVVLVPGAWAHGASRRRAGRNADDRRAARRARHLAMLAQSAVARAEGRHDGLQQRLEHGKVDRLHQVTAEAGSG